MSFSLVAAIPAKTVVHTADTIIVFFVISYFIDIVKRFASHTPAVTSVDEWTSEDVGVGAAIAAGSHAEKGTWALFVIAEAISKIFVAVIF